MKKIDDTFKVKQLAHGLEESAFKSYKRLFYGRHCTTGQLIRAEMIFSLFGPLPGAAGLFLRKQFYPRLFGTCGKGFLVGRNVTFRHPQKIHFGRNVIVDDNCMIDAKGEGNRGIFIGDNVFIGRNTIIYCKDGDIVIDEGVNISSNCTLFSSNHLRMKPRTVVGAYSYLLSGGEYDYTDPQPFSNQSGMVTRGNLVVGENCWLGARVTVTDAASIGDHCVIGAGAVVNKPIVNNSLAVGVPAKVIKTL